MKHDQFGSLLSLYLERSLRKENGVLISSPQIRNFGAIQNALNSSSSEPTCVEEGSGSQRLPRK